MRINKRCGKLSKMQSQNKEDFMVIGVTGEPSSGKDTFAKYIEEKGFRHISSGDYLRSQAEKLGIPLDRGSIQRFAINKRKEKGPQYPTDEFIDEIKENTVVSGFRNMSESNLIKSRFKENYILVGITALPETRFERMKKRGRIGDNITFGRFLEEQEIDRSIKGEGVQETDKVIENADYKIDNSGSEEEFKAKVDEWFKNIILK